MSYCMRCGLLLCFTRGQICHIACAVVYYCVLQGGKYVTLHALWSTTVLQGGKCVVLYVLLGKFVHSRAQFMTVLHTLLDQ